MGLSSVSGHWEASKNVLGETWGRSRVGFGGPGGGGPRADHVGALGALFGHDATSWPKKVLNLIS